MTDIQISILRLLRERNMTRQELRRRTGISGTTINRICTGKEPYPRLDTMRTIADVFGVTLDEVAGEKTKEASE